MIKFDYINNPIEIYNKSFSALLKEIDLAKIPKDMHSIAIRIVHSCGNPSILNSLDFSDNAASYGRKALENNANILCDTEMVKCGIIKRMLPNNNKVICTLNHSTTDEIASDRMITRSSAAVELWEPLIKNSVIVIGNAPTALFYLLEKIHNNSWKKPALIVGCPIGYVGASESKQALIEFSDNIPYITIKGRMGGSSIASSIVNAICGSNDLSRWRDG